MQTQAVKDASDKRALCSGLKTQCSALLEACLPVENLFGEGDVWSGDFPVSHPPSPSPIHSIPQLPKHSLGAALFPWRQFPFPDLCVLLEQPVSPRKQHNDPAHSCIIFFIFFCSRVSLVMLFETIIKSLQRFCDPLNTDS